MLSVSQIAPYFTEDNVQRKIKPWWENITDYLTHSLLVIAMVSWTFLLQDHSAGVNCIPKDPERVQIWSSLHARYFSQKCASEVYDGCMVYYPYFVFCQWMVLFLCQVFWLKLPQVNSKFEFLHQIFDKMDARREKSCMIKEKLRNGTVLESKSICKTEDFARFRLHYFLQGNGTTISFIYCSTKLLIFLLGSTFIGLTFHFFPQWTDLWTIKNISYHIPLNRNERLKDMHLFCNLGCGRLTFVLICLNLLVLFAFIIMSFFGYGIWLHNRDRIQKLIQTGYSPDLKNSAGWKDLCATLGFVNANKQFGKYSLSRLVHLLLTLNEGLFNGLDETCV